MADIQIPDSASNAPARSPSVSASQPSQESIVCDSWQHMLQLVLGFVFLAFGIALLRYYEPTAAHVISARDLRYAQNSGLTTPSQNSASDTALKADLQTQVHELTAQVEQLKQEQSMPAVVLNRYRNSIGYIYGVYQVGFPNHHPAIRARVSGTGFLVSDGLIATNRHVAEPWYGDPDAEHLIDRGAAATLESLVIFFPGSPTPVTLLPGSASKTSDLAVLRVEDASAVRGLAVLPLAKSPSSPGQFVTVIGYPLGIAGMVAKSPNGIYERLAFRHNDISAASELAALSLIRPSTTCGHLGDVVGDKLIYDAPTAHGGSGGPVFNSKGEVIGVNSAYMDGFTGGTLGISVDSLRPLLDEVKTH
jgi:S1-C subfamily serine protease